MLKNDREKSICERYSARDSEGFVHCKACPLAKDPILYGFGLCKAVAHYDRNLKEWVPDKEGET